MRKIVIIDFIQGRITYEMFLFNWEDYKLQILSKRGLSMRYFYLIRADYRFYSREDYLQDILFNLGRLQTLSKRELPIRCFT